LEEADRFFGSNLSVVSTEPRQRVFQGAIGEIKVKVEAEGGHYTLITITTDQVGESEADKQAKRFLGVVHTRVDRDHVLRGAY
jgi:hypothetical protein